MKKIIIILIFVSLVLIVGGSLYYFYGQKTPAKEKEKASVIDLFPQTTEPSEKQKELLEILDRWGKKWYENKDYMSGNKKSTVYFISLSNLKEKYGYDISAFHDENGNACDINRSGVYIDIENNLGRRFDDGNYIPYFPILVGC